MAIGSSLILILRLYLSSIESSQGEETNLILRTHSGRVAVHSDPRYRLPRISTGGMMTQVNLGEPICTINLRMTGMVEYGGPSAPLLLSGKERPTSPALLDSRFEGTFEGARLRGTVTNGVDYVTFRPDGSIELELFATWVTHDGVNLAYRADGWAYHHEGRVLIRKTGRLHTLDQRYGWIASHTIFALGELNLADKTIALTAYRP
jgi:hypothetical protein